MKTWIRILLLLAVLGGCSSRGIEGRQAQAEKELVGLSSALQSGNFDSIRLITSASADINYYIYDPSFKLVFWSENVLSLNEPTIPGYDKWFEQSFANADCMCRWSRVGGYYVLTAIPTAWHISAREEIEQSFSYRPLIKDNSEDSSWLTASGTRVRMYYLIMIALFILIVAYGIGALIKHHGIKDMSLQLKLQREIITIVLVAFGYIFATSVSYVRHHYAERQKTSLQEKCRFIQSALQNLYYWDYSISRNDGVGLSVDLRDLAHTYALDIHVYDLDGRLIGSSTPSLFERGLLSDHLAPEVFFSDESTMTLYSTLGDISYLSAYTDFLNGTFGKLGYIAVPSFISEDEMAREVDAYMARLLPAYLLVLILALIASVLFARLLTHPLAVMAQNMKDLEIGAPHHYIDYPYHDEVGELVARYNQMVDQLDLFTRRLARSEREGAWRTMARQVAHEINNPLTPMKLTIQQLQRVKDTERFDELFARATAMLIEQIDNLSRIATSFSTFARLPQVETTAVDIADKLTAAISLSTNNSHNIPIRYVGPDSNVIVEADGEQIGQVFTNIFRNAIQAIGDRPDGDIIVVLSDQGKEVEISISDNGPGIPEEVRDKIFVPDFTTKSNGTGLGLSISKNIVEGSDGRITFTTSDKGTTFYIYLRKIIQS